MDEDIEDLSPTARRMLELRDEVLEAWQARLREQIPQADMLVEPILVNTLPAYYDNIARAISPGNARRTATDGNTLATEHGGERARLSAYDHESLIAEYQVLRWAIFEVLARAGMQLTHQEYLVIDASIDAGIKEAVSGFTMVHSALRERFAAALTHDMRGPLQVALTALELIMMTRDPTVTQTMAVKARESLRRMDSMIGELLHSMSFAGGHPMELHASECEIMELIKEVHVDTVAVHGPRLSVAGAAVRGWWSRTELKRAIENVVSNAFKYGYAHTPVSIRISESHGRMLVSVHNEGKPIPEQEQECIFQLYRRAEAAKLDQAGGWGIGLPYVRAVAESHGGSVVVDSTEQGGTTFTIDIPVDTRTLQNAPTAAA